MLVCFRYLMIGRRSNRRGRVLARVWRSRQSLVRRRLGFWSDAIAACALSHRHSLVAELTFQ